MEFQNMPVAEELRPVEAYLSAPDRGALAIITKVDGPSYRPIGAMMALFEDATWVGTLSSGCVESDINIHARNAREKNEPTFVKYGKGSPYMDIKLPCGGGLEILILPDPNIELLTHFINRLKQRCPTTLQINLKNGDISVLADGPTGYDGDNLFVRYEPDPSFLIFGKGPEASTFSALVNAAGYPSLLLSPDEETLKNATKAGCKTRHISHPYFPDDLVADHRTAIVLFFHDHDWEPDILLGALNSAAFYIGAQGSRAASITRLMEMQDKGATKEQLSRLVGPIGLIPSTRDAKTLSISVLADVLSRLHSLKELERE